MSHHEKDAYARVWSGVFHVRGHRADGNGPEEERVQCCGRVSGEGTEGRGGGAARECVEAGGRRKLGAHRRGTRLVSGGDKAKGQQIFDAVTSSKKAKGSDWFRVGRVYVEANEWDKAQAAFDKALAMEPDDDSAHGRIRVALLNVIMDRAKAESFFAKAMAKNPGDFWHWVSAGGSYLGVPPQ